MSQAGYCQDKILKGRAFNITTQEARANDDVVNNTFLVDARYASVLFDSGADKCFVSLEFESYLLKSRTSLDEPLSVEVTSGKSVETKFIIRNCSITLKDLVFSN